MDALNGHIWSRTTGVSAGFSYPSSSYFDPIIAPQFQYAAPPPQPWAMEASQFAHINHSSDAALARVKDLLTAPPYAGPPSSAFCW